MKKTVICLLTFALVCLTSMTPVFAQESKLQAPNSPSGVVVPMGQFATINEDNVRLRANAGLSAPVLMYLHTGYVVSYAYATDDNPSARLYVDGMWWRHVTYVDGGVTGYVAEQYLNFIG